MDIVKQDLRRIVIENDLVSKLNKHNKTVHFHFWKNRVIDNIDFIHNLGFDVDVAKTAIEMLDALNKRRQRVFSYIDDMLRNTHLNVYFCTLTFTDYVLDNTSYDTRRKYVARFCKETGCIYVANIDFGDKKKNKNSNEREHYHAIICTNRTLPKKDIGWLYGFSLAKPVGRSSDNKDQKKISKYINKLSLHALKQTKNSYSPKLIYSRNVLPF